MHDISFVLVGNYKFFSWINKGIDQINSFYPDSQIWLYDLNPDLEPNLESLAVNGKVVYKPWSQEKWTPMPWFDMMTMNDLPETSISNDIKSRMRGIVKKYILFNKQSWERSSTVLERWRFQLSINAQRPFVFLDAAKNIDNKFVLIDADAFILDRIDDLFEKSFDIGVTMRRIHELSFTSNQCRVLNSGVVIFNCSREKAVGFIEEWIRQLMNTKGFDVIEQTSLTHLIQKIRPDIYSGFYNSGTLHLSDELSVCVEILPCEKYNYNWIEEGVNYEKVKIVHFKGGRHEAGNLKLVDDILNKAKQINLVTS